MQTIIEGKAKIKVPDSPNKVMKNEISKELPVFYNPIMEFNRELSVLILNSILKQKDYSDKKLQIALPLAASGIRGIRLMLEVPKGKIKTLYMNDYDKKAINLIEDNLRLNELGNGIGNKIKLSCKDANEFMLQEKGFDYIDIDPFGSPNSFLDAACKRISRGGILGVTATDTSLLSGTYSDACKRSYFAIPLRNELKHEIGLRILIRKVQLIAAQYEKALMPIFSLSHEHYMKIFFICKKGKKKVDELIKEHKYFIYYPSNGNFTIADNLIGHLDKNIQIVGPIWSGQLYDQDLVNQITTKSNIEKSSQPRILETIKNESKYDVVGLYDLHAICKKNNLSIPKMDKLLKLISGSRTHINQYAIKTKLDFDELIEIVRNIK